MTSLSVLLDTFGRQETGRPLGFDEHGVCQLDFRGGRRLAIEPDLHSSRAWIYSVLGPIPIGNPGMLFGKLLAANLFGHMTQDAWFAIDPDRGEIVLNRTFDTAQLDPVAFSTLVLGFMDLVEAWSGPIEQESAAPALSVAETEPIQAFASQTMIRG